jgi:hypothetical protein
MAVSCLLNVIVCVLSSVRCFARTLLGVVLSSVRSDSLGKSSEHSSEEEASLLKYVCSCLREKNLGKNSRRDLKTRITVLTSASRNLTDRPTILSPFEGGRGPLLYSVKRLHWKTEPSSRRRGGPISKTRKCLGQNKNLLGVTLSVLSSVRSDILCIRSTQIIFS